MENLEVIEKKKLQRCLIRMLEMNCNMKMLIADLREVHVHVSLTIPLVPWWFENGKFPECAE